MIFGTILILGIRAWKSKQLQYNLSGNSAADKIVGVIALVFGFYYLHWVDSPILTNALFHSPLGIVNCPTLLALCGLICLADQPDEYLTGFVGTMTLYFGFFGIMRLDAYIDVLLIVVGMYLLLRMACRHRQSNLRTCRTEPTTKHTIRNSFLCRRMAFTIFTVKK